MLYADRIAEHVNHVDDAADEMIVPNDAEGVVDAGALLALDGRNDHSGLHRDTRKMLRKAKKKREKTTDKSSYRSRGSKNENEGLFSPSRASAADKMMWFDFEQHVRHLLENMLGPIVEMIGEDRTTMKRIDMIN